MRDILAAIEQLNSQPDFAELPQAGLGESELSHIDKLQVGTDSPHTEYSGYLGRHYLAAGFSPSESCQFLDILIRGSKEPIPYLVIPLRGGNLPWLESTALYLGSTPAVTLAACLQVGSALTTVSRYARSLQQHARVMQLHISSLQTHLAKELAEAYVRLPSLDETMLKPTLELAEIYGEPPKAKKVKTPPGRFDESKLNIPGMDGASAQWLCEAGRWTIRGIRHQAELVIQQAKCIMDFGIVKGAEEPRECIEAGLESALFTLKSAEQNLAQVGKGLERIDSIFHLLIPFVKSSPRPDDPWKNSASVLPQPVA